MPDLPDITEQIGNLLAGIRQMKQATDGHYTIVAASILEQDLERALLTKMRPLNASERERLFDRALHFSGKIDLASALNLIDEEFYSTLKLINKVRVAFAHSTTMRHFGDPEIATIVAQIPKLDSSISDVRLRLLKKMKEIEVHLDKIVAASAPASSSRSASASSS